MTKLTKYYCTVCVKVFWNSEGGGLSPCCDAPLSEKKPKRKKIKGYYASFEDWQAGHKTKGYPE